MVDRKVLTLFKGMVENHKFVLIIFVKKTEVLLFLRELRLTLKMFIWVNSLMMKIKDGSILFYLNYNFYSERFGAHFKHHRK